DRAVGHETGRDVDVAPLVTAQGVGIQTIFQALQSGTEARGTRVHDCLTGKPDMETTLLGCLWARRHLDQCGETAHWRWGERASGAWTGVSGLGIGSARGNLRGLTGAARGPLNVMSGCTDRQSTRRSDSVPPVSCLTPGQEFLALIAGGRGPGGVIPR